MIKCCLTSSFSFCRACRSLSSSPQRFLLDSAPSKRGFILGLNWVKAWWQSATTRIKYFCHQLTTAFSSIPLHLFRSHQLESLMSFIQLNILYPWGLNKVSLFLEHRRRKYKHELFEENCHVSEKLISIQGIGVNLP